MRTLAAEKVAIVCEIRVRNSVCVWIQKERERWMFSPPRPVTVVFFSPLSTSTSRFFSFWKRDFLLFLPPVRRRHNPQISPLKSPQTQKKRGRSRHILLSVVSRSPGKLFKRTLTYRGKRTQRYVKRRERERKEEEAHFLLRLARVVVRTRGEKVARRRKEFSEQTTSA